jgi:hypothetical protein
MTVNRWTGKGNDQLWFDAKNWTQGVPVGQQPISFSDGGTWSISLAGGLFPAAGAATILRDNITFANDRVDLNAAQPKTGVKPDLTIGEGGSLTVGTDAIVVAEHAVQLGATANGTLTSGTLLVQGALWTSDFQELTGSVTVDGGSITPIGGSLAMTFGGTVQIVDAGRLGDEFGTTQVTDITVGNFFTDGALSVSGSGSAVRAQSIDLGNGFSGSLLVANGAAVDADSITGGVNGDATVTVTGAATLAASNSLQIGGTVPVASSLIISDHGSVYAGGFGLSLEEGSLIMDPTAQLIASIFSEGGKIIAMPTAGHTGGTVTIAQPIALGDLFADPQFGNVTWAEGQGGAELRLIGRITDTSLSDVLRVATVTVAVTNPANTIGSTELGNASLIVGHPGALGGGTMTFLSGDTSASLVVGMGPFHNTIGGFASGDSIDLVSLSAAA